MSGNNPKRSRNSMPSFLIGALLLPLVIFFAWTASRSANPAGTAVAVRRNDPPLASGRAVSYSTAGQPGVQIVLKYGRAEGEIGMVLGHGQPPVGPESFAVGKDGGILVADVVNQRVVAYSSNGAYLRTIDLPGIALGDVTADAQGGLYVYDQVRHALHQYHADGTLRSTLNLNPADIDTRGYFHVAGNAFYFADAAARDVLVATLQDGLLAPPDKALERTTDGIHGESGRIYSMSVDKGQALRLQVRDPAAQSVARSVEVPLPGIVSARYAGEDQAQRFYVQTERLAGTSIVLEVLAFSRAGEQLAATRMPENDYAIWTAKLVDVRTDGTIVQFLPQQTQAKLNLFAN